MKEKKHYSTRELANIFCVQPETVRRGYCVNGQYLGIVPKKLPNNRLLWSVMAVNAITEQRETE